MFASKTPRDLNPLAAKDHGMLPGSHESTYGPACRCGAGWDYYGETCAADHVQHNEPNPILPAFRHEFSRVSEAVDRESLIWGWTSWFRSNPLPEWSADHIDHARKVLTRLARFTEGVS